MKRLTLFMILIIGSSFSQEPKASQVPPGKGRSPRILLVVAHPDDEYDMAATVYRVTTELHGTVDENKLQNENWAGSELQREIRQISLTHDKTVRHYSGHPKQLKLLFGCRGILVPG